jgi:hypothetical protein
LESSSGFSLTDDEVTSRFRTNNESDLWVAVNDDSFCHFVTLPKSEQSTLRALYGVEPEEHENLRLQGLYHKAHAELLQFVTSVTNLVTQHCVGTVGYTSYTEKLRKLSTIALDAQILYDEHSEKNGFEIHYHCYTAKQ